MITNVLSAIAFDVAKVAEQDGFFDKNQADKLTVIEQDLGKTYPAELVEWLQKVSEQDLVNELNALLPMFAEQKSVFESMRRVREFSFLQAFAEALLHGLLTDRHQKATALQSVLEPIQTEDSTRTLRIMTREAQQFLLEAMDIDSPIVQVAAEMDDDQQNEVRAELIKKSPGLPQLLVNKRLLGGLRIFHGSKLQDFSWRAKLDSFFSELR